MASDVLNPFPTEKKVSRYRSLRQQKQAVLPEETPVESPEVEETLKRSMSRYHRSRNGTVTTQSGPVLGPARPNPDNQSPVPAGHGPATSLEQSSPRNRSHTVGAHAASRDSVPELPVKSPRRPTTSHRTDRTSRHRQEPALNEGQQLLADESARYERVRAHQRAVRESQQAEREAKKKADALEKLKRQEEAKEKDRLQWEQIAEEDRRQKAEAEKRRKRAKEREEEEERQRNQLLEKERPADIVAPTKADNESVTPASPPSNRTQTSAPSYSSVPSTKRFGLFKRSRGASSPGSHKSPPATAERRPKTSRTKEPPMIKPGGGGIVPLNDAPISAVNHGGRRVRIKCGKSFITLPVTPTTSALQLIRSASNVMSENVDPRASVLVEVFTKAGVRRPLRMYEHIRDVMNSWDDDDQHSLVIEQSEAGAKNNELYVSFTPKQKPGEASWWLYYSQKPKKWEKRWVTLRQDGQLTIAKNQSGKNLMNVCHVSDFDVYTPTPEQKKKRIKPPKKYCHAIKSQQKSTMFMSTANFIHIFCSNDKQVADSFFSKVQAWRSWYLVNVMGEGQASKGEQKPVEEKAGPNLVGSTSPQHTRNASVDSHYILGSFNTLDFDPNAFTKPAPEPQAASKGRSSSFSDTAPLASFGLMQPSALAHSKAIPTRNPSQRKKPNLHPPTAFRSPQDSVISSQGPHHRPSTSHVSSQRHPGGEQEGSFNPHGLLGAQYEQRQRDLQQGGIQRGNSVRSTRSQRRNSVDGSAMDRTGSVRGGSAALRKPLIDLTPQYQEPPQFQKKGKGYKPDTNGTLIDSATSPDVVIPIPPSQDWKARPTTSSGPTPRRSGSVRHNPSGSISRAPPGQHTNSAIDRSKSLKGHGVKVHGQMDSFDDFDAFTGGGLLANSASGWGSGDRGHGVMSGNQAKGPLLDMTEKRQFAAGSLLARTERGAQP